MSLTKIKGFYPYLMLVFFNTFVDLGHKILLQDILYQTADGTSYTILSAIINAMILLPYIFLFTPSGFIADRFPKSKVLKITAAAAVPLTILITFFYYQGFFWAAFATTLLLAIQSALNSPAKYGYIKEIFGKENLAQANAIVQTLTIIAILAGTFCFTLLFSHFVNTAGLQKSLDKGLLMHSFASAGFILIACATLEALMSLRLPQRAAVDPNANYEVKKYLRGGYLKPYLSKAASNHVIITCIFGLAVFWALNQVLLASYGAFLKENIGDVSVIFAQGSLALAGIGILLGALYAGKVSRGFIETGLIPVAAIGISLGLFLLPSMSSKLSISLLFLGYGFFGGMLIVPLNSLIQFNAGESDLGKILSANNFIQNCFMVSFLVLTVLFSLTGINSLSLMYTLFAIALAGAIYSFIALPQSLVRYLIYTVVSKFYSVRVFQLNNLPSTGGVLLLGNHVSFIDWAILQIACPRPIRFVMERGIYEKWYLKWFLKQFQIIPISKGHSKEALEEVHTALNQGEVVAIFPEGRLSRNGQLGTFRSGFERAAQNTKAVIVPFYLYGLWGAKTSYAPEHYKQISKIKSRRLGVIYGQRMSVDSTATEVKSKVRELSITAWRLMTNELQSIPAEWMDKANRQGSSLALIDSSGASFSSHKLKASVLYFAGKLAPLLKNQQNVGLILPSSAAGTIANMALLCRGKTVVNLNYTSGESAIEFALKQAGIQTIITSRFFREKLLEKGFDLTRVFNGTTVIYLEDFKNQTTKLHVARYLLLVKCLPVILLKKLFIKKTDINSTAAIMFSSGSEGQPKGIELTHRNILSNIKQVASVLSLQESDVMLNALPLFHAFGFTTTMLTPLVQGIPMVSYPDPTNTLAMAQLIYRNRITIMCATSTFLGMYARNTKIHPLMLSSLRLVISGAEKLAQTVYEDFKKKFTLEIYEGYGATEVAPVASTNLPDVLSADDWYIYQSNKPGTVGLPLPGSAFRIIDPETGETLPPDVEGLILIGGTQVMRGYLNDEDRTKQVLIKEGDLTWYKTGDKGYLDNDGYLTIVDRYSRFAKIGGEMVSLGQVEQQTQQLLNDPESDLMAVAIPDPRKGERIVLLYEGQLSEDQVMVQLTQTTLNRLMLPAQVIKIDAMPKLGNGKKDYTAAKMMVSESGLS